MYKLSIIIPTKNRQQYCIMAIKQICSLKLGHTQIVIQDNSDDSSLSNLIDEIGDDNIKYNYHSGIISFVDNFSEAVAHADGEYICMIGDDDGILSNIEEVIRKFESTCSFDAIVPGLNSVYFWPSENPIVKGAQNGYLCLSFIKNKIAKIDPQKCLLELLKEGGQNYQKIGLPRLYHGIVRKAVLDKLYMQTGRIFDGLTPDIYMAVALSFVCNDVYAIDFPVTISGICSQSGSSDSATGKHTGKLSDAPHFRGHENYIWEEIVPKIYSVETIWGESALKAIRVFNRDDMYGLFSIRKLDAICYLKYPQFRSEIISHAKMHGIKPRSIKSLAIWTKITQQIQKLTTKLFRKKGSVEKHYGVKDIFVAEKLTSQKIHKKIKEIK